MTGTLFLIPTHISESAPVEAILPADVRDRALALNFYMAENAKSARAFLKAIGAVRPLAEVTIAELDKHPDPKDIGTQMRRLLSPLAAGNDMGLVSEAGAPAVADPGALVVAAAHEMGARVVPMVGPSSILLALMGSGLNGQLFKFNGYLPLERATRISAIQRLERESRDGTTQIFIETPYRNAAMASDLLSSLAPTTQLCIATDLTGPGELIKTKKVEDWRRQGPVWQSKQPALFLLLAKR